MSMSVFGVVFLILVLLSSNKILVFPVLGLSHPRSLLLRNPNALLSSVPLLQHGQIAADDDFLKLDEKALGLLNTNATAMASSEVESHIIVKSSTSCQSSYGVLPCSDTLIGNTLLLLAYGYLLYLAARHLSHGSELLLTVLDPGVISGLLLPILGALPNSLIILVSGLQSTQSEAQVMVGIGLLAGSSVMLLTLLWGSCLLLGRCDLEQDERGKLSAQEKVLSRPWALAGSGVESDGLTKLSARMMTISTIPFAIPQLPSIFGFSSNVPSLVASILAFGGLIAYSIFQVLNPSIQEQQKETALKMVFKATSMKQLIMQIDAERKSLVDANGNLNDELAERLFHAIDKDNDGKVQKSELALMLSTILVNESVDNAMVEYILTKYDVDEDGEISLEEFLNGTRKWSNELNLHHSPDIAAITKRTEGFVTKLLEAGLEEAQEQIEAPSQAQMVRKAILYLFTGTGVATVFASPLVDAVNNFSTASSVPSFFISFVFIAIALSSSELKSSILFSAKKMKRNMSLAYAQIYGTVTMNNTLGLGIFLAVVYFRQLDWDFSSEVLVVCLVNFVMGLVASFKTVLPTWMGCIALLLYPLSLGLIAVLDYGLGWN